MWELIKTIFIALAKVFGWAETNRQLNAGNAEQRANEAEGALDAVTKANEARQEAADANKSVTRTDELPDDGFRRD